MAAPIFSFVNNVSTNIAICTIMAPLPWTVTGGGSVALPQNTQLQSEVIDLAIFSLVAGSTAVGTVVTLQELGLDSALSAGVLAPVWRTVVTGGATSTPVTISKQVLQGELNQPRIGARGGDLSESTGHVARRCRVAELCVVQKVEELRAELQRLPFGELGGLDQRPVEIQLARSLNDP